MKILVRLPNWLGDIVMSTGFLQVLGRRFPNAQVDVIIKAEYAGLAKFLPGIVAVYPFSKATHKGLKGAYKFGKELAPQQYNLYFSLPDSFSTAVMGWATGAKHRVGYGKELRSWLLTHAVKKAKAQHRTDEYVHLLESYLGEPLEKVPVAFINTTPSAAHGQAILPTIVLNFNSEAQSRRVPVQKAASILQGLNASIKAQFLLVGGPKDAAYVEEVIALAGNTENVESLAGKTNLTQLIEVMAAASLVITSDSGPAHVANSLNRNMIVLFGAGDEANTGPYNRKNAEVMRVANLPCAPCRSNTCRFGVPMCLLQQDEALLIQKAKSMLAEV